MSDSGMNMVEDFDRFETIQAQLESFNQSMAAHSMDIDTRNIMPEVGTVIKTDLENEGDEGRLEVIELEEEEVVPGDHKEEEITIMEDDSVHGRQFTWGTNKVHILSDEHTEDGVLFSEDVTGEEIISGEQIIIKGVSGNDYETEEYCRVESDCGVYEEIESLGNERYEEEVITEHSVDPLYEEMEEATAENVLVEETVVDEPLSAEMAKHFSALAEKVAQPPPVEPKPLAPSVYVVSSSGGSIITTPHLLQNTIVKTPVKETITSSPKITKMIVSNDNSGAGQSIRFLSTQGKLLSSAAKPLTYAEAKKIGIITQGNHLIPVSKSAVTVPMGKVVVPAQKKTVTVACAKSPTKILPAPNPSVQPITVQSIGPKTQKVLIKHANTLKPGTLLTSSSGGQMIRFPSAQNVSQGSTIHQIQLPRKPVQFVKLVGPSGGKTSTTLVPVSALSKSIPLALPTSILNSSQQTTFKVVPMSTAQAQPGQRVLIPASAVSQSSGSGQNSQQTVNNIVMLSPQLLQPVKKLKEAVIVSSQTPTSLASASPSNIVATSTSVANEAESVSSSAFTPGVVSSSSNGSNNGQATNSNLLSTLLKTEAKHEPAWSGDEAMTTLEANGIRPKKPCNCTKSMCLKLYCDCFANGEFCNQCNCTCCYNNLEHEEDRQRAIKSCLERNPTAFRPKIGKSFVGSEERRHNKGCNCRRSGCLKNYCECYEAKIPCSKNCKCIGCKNIDGVPGRLADNDERNFLLTHSKITNHRASSEATISQKTAFNLSQEVVRTTCECLMAHAEFWEKESGGLSGSSNGRSPNLEQLESLIIQEFGECLVQIIDCVSRSSGTNHK